MTWQQDVARSLDFLPDFIVVAILAASPVLEVRGSIPVAAVVFDMPWAEAFTWSLLGNLAVLPPLWAALPHVEALLRRAEWAARTLDRIFARTRSRSIRRIETYEEAAVFFLVAVPLPGSGLWTGILAAYVFGLQKRKSWPFLFAGAVVACFAMVIITYGAKAVF